MGNTYMKPDHIKKLLPILNAYAEGKTIQYKIEGDMSAAWRDSYGELSFTNSPESYRIKPAGIKYRKYLYKTECGFAVGTAPYADPYNSIKDLENAKNFIKWIDTDWIEYEI